MIMPAQRTRDIINAAAVEYGVSFARIVGPRRDAITVSARVKAAKALWALGYSGINIGRALNRDHATIIYYLGRRNDGRKPVCRPPPSEKVAPVETVAEPCPVKSPAYLVPYAGADFGGNYRLKERS